MTALNGITELIADIIGIVFSVMILGLVISGCAFIGRWLLFVVNTRVEINPQYKMINDFSTKIAPNDEHIKIYNDNLKEILRVQEIQGKALEKLQTDKEEKLEKIDEAITEKITKTILIE